MRIGLYFECQKSSGGAYQYALNLLGALKPLDQHNFVVFNISKDFPFEEYGDLKNWQIVNLISLVNAGQGAESNISLKSRLIDGFNYLKRRLNLFIIACLRFFHLYSIEILLSRYKAKQRAENFKKYDLDLIFFHGASDICSLIDIPSIVPVHDIHHKLHPELPEVTKFGQWQKREYAVKKIIKSSYKILVNSKTCGSDLVEIYGANPRKIVPVPCPPPAYLRNELKKATQQSSLKLPKRYIFYPAQFWPHKNHANLVRAMKILREEMAEDIDLVLVGSRQDLWGEFDRVNDLIKELGLENNIHILGYVENSDMPLLYRNSEMVAMPALFGFTYPAFEAWQTRRPLLYSNSRDAKEQIGRAALLVNPYDPQDIAEKIRRLINDQKLREELIQYGIERLSQNTHLDLQEKIKEVIDNFEKNKNPS